MTDSVPYQAYRSKRHSQTLCLPPSPSPSSSPPLPRHSTFRRLPRRPPPAPSPLGPDSHSRNVLNPPASTSPVPPPATSSPSPPHSPASAQPPSSITSPTPQRVQAPYRPGFQPKGLYRPLTDEFLALRRAKRDGDGHDGRSSGMKRIERTKMLRRLEKLIDLHFPEQNPSSTATLDRHPRRQQGDHRRASSFFDFDIKKINISDPGGLLRGVVGGGDVHDLRAAEQRITPWQDDADVSKCPLCSRIEEVDQGVDYGVRRKPLDNSNSPIHKGGPATEEKFLKGALIALEQEIEESLPQFQELVLSLSHNDQPTKEASISRKRLLEAFAQYDALAKRIRKLPCPAGSSADQVQSSIMNRANLFLQKNMFPLQSLPKPKKSTIKTTSVSSDDGQKVDPDSEIAVALQPLLEQEALLESFVEEAKAHRKFEDVKTLKTNLQEIRAEIDRIVANADAGLFQGNGKAHMQH
ncbi:hypothetical protein C0995_002724 [Termitomyces sp. Mi166|nr:hypothetical protein C0995_002724 [Termitomyces sp. Mi166\